MSEERKNLQEPMPPSSLNKHHLTRSGKMIMWQSESRFCRILRNGNPIFWTPGPHSGLPWQAQAALAWSQPAVSDIKAWVPRSPWLIPAHLWLLDSSCCQRDQGDQNCRCTNQFGKMVTASEKAECRFRDTVTNSGCVYWWTCRKPPFLGKISKNYCSD